jgi:hypothetical protein
MAGGDAGQLCASRAFPWRKVGLICVESVRLLQHAEYVPVKGSRLMGTDPGEMNAPDWA